MFLLLVACTAHANSMAHSLTAVTDLQGAFEANKAEERARGLAEEWEALSVAGNAAESIDSFMDLLGLLRVGTDAERIAAVDVLADVVGAAFGDDGARIGRAVRESGALDDLRDLLSMPQAREPTLLVIGNLVSDSVDTGSSATKIALIQCEGAAEAIVECIDQAEDAQALAFAVGALQNLCHDRDWSDLLMQRGVHSTLEALLAHPDELVVRYASGALKNMTATLQDAAILSQNALSAVGDRSHEANVEEFRYRRAAAIIIRHIQATPPDVRLRRLLRAKERQEKEAIRGTATPAARAEQSREKRRAAGISSRASSTSSRASSRAGPRTPSSAVSLSNANAALPQSSTPSSADKPPSDASSSHSGSTAYYSVASSTGKDKEKATVAAAQSGPPAGSACFEV